MSLNDLTLDLSDKAIAEAFAGNKVGDECLLENVNLRVKRISMSHDDEYDPKSGKPTGKKKVRGSIDFEVLDFDYGDSNYDLDSDKSKDKAGKEDSDKAYPQAAPSRSGMGMMAKKPAVAVVVGLGKPRK